MTTLRRSSLVLVLMLACDLSASGDSPLRIDREKSFVDVDVKATVDSFTGRLEKYQAVILTDPSGRIRTATFDFRFSDLKTGKADRDAKMLDWLGSIDAGGRFELGVLALTPSGQGQANGRLTFHGATQRIEFPVAVTRVDRAYTIAGEVTLDHRNWGLKVIRMMGLLKVDPEVRVRFRLAGELPPLPEE